MSLLVVCMPVAVCAQQEVFPLPDVPKTLTTPTDRANYLALHYWDNYNFRDNSLIGNEDISEQGFSNFISIMPYVSEKEKAFSVFAHKISQNAKMSNYFMAIAQKYLAEPLSPVYNEELYILLLQSYLSLDGLTEKERSEYGFTLKMARKNCLGTQAADFSFMLRGGKRCRLSDIKGEYILLILGDPECDVCTDTKERILGSSLLMGLINKECLIPVSVCVEGNTEAWRNTKAPTGWVDACDDNGIIYEQLLYDIPGLPVMYLLDYNRKVLVKNATVGLVENYFKDR